jgi:hypothetical protein
VVLSCKLWAFSNAGLHVSLGYIKTLLAYISTITLIHLERQSLNVPFPRTRYLSLCLTISLKHNIRMHGKTKGKIFGGTFRFVFTVAFGNTG